MRIMISRTGLIAGLLLLCSFLYAQNENPEVLTLKVCIKQALDHNPKLISAELEARKARWKIKEVRSSGLPQVNISGTLDDYLKLPTSLIPGEIFGKPGELIPVQFGTKYNMSGNLDASQLIFSKTYFTGLKAANELNLLQELNTEKVKEEIIYQVAQLYFTARITSIQRNNLYNALGKLDTLENITRLQYDNGFIKKIDLDRIVVTKVNLQTEISNVELIYQQQVSVLKYHLGIDNSKEVYLADSADTENLLVSLEPNTGNHIDIRLLEKQKALAWLDLQANKSAYFPTLAAYGRYSYQNMQNEFKFGNGSPDWLNTSMIGLSLNVPVFDGFLKNSKVQQSKIWYEQISINTEDSRNYLNTALKNASGSYLNSKNNYEIQEKNIALAENIWQVSFELYQKGLAPLTDLLNAETTLKESLNNRAQAHIRMQLAALDLLKTNGQIMSILNK